MLILNEVYEAGATLSENLISNDVDVYANKNPTNEGLNPIIIEPYHGESNPSTITTGCSTLLLLDSTNALNHGTTGFSLWSLKPLST